MPKKIDAASPWNPSSCRQLERLAQANKIVLADLQEKTRHRKSLEEDIANRNAAASRMTLLAERERALAEIKDLKAEHFDTEAEITECRAKRDAYHDKILETIDQAAIGTLFDEEAELLPDPPAPETKAEDTRPVGRPDEATPEPPRPPAPTGVPLKPARGAELIMQFPGRYRIVSAVPGGRPAEITAGDMQNLDEQLQGIVGVPFTFEATYGRLSGKSDGGLIATLVFIERVEAHAPETNGVDQRPRPRVSGKKKTKKATAKAK